ncbi:MAG: hypothetical protein GX051_00815 [Clostridiales bacterium]|nr:hypothetical protein [Clostridiales bacterium]
MTEKERFIKALRREPLTGHVPTFELVFFLTLEALGRIAPEQQHFYQWSQMSDSEREAHFDYIAETYVQVARKYHHSAIFVQANPGDFDSVVRTIELIREKSGDEFFIMCHGDPTFEIPNGDNMLEFTARMYEEPEALKREAQNRLEGSLRFAENMAKHPGLLDGFALCSDYCFNINPFFSPDMFSEFVAPYLSGVLKEYRDMGYYSIKHTDGNIMPIIDQIADCKPDALHSLDPQGGVSLAEVKRLYGNRLCLIGNVNCGLLQTGTDEECAADVRRALREGMPGYGYIFSTSNCVYTGLSLERYEMMNNIWWNEGVYAPGPDPEI